MKAYFADKPEEAKKYDCSENILIAEKMPFGLIDQGSHDDFLADMGIEKLKAAIGKGGHKIKHRMQDGYNHYFPFVSTFMPEHIAFHAMHIHK
jgi:S-formylglutathione hydrolase